MVKRRVTVTDAGQAAELLGIDAYDLGQMLREAAARKIEEAAGDIRRHDEPNLGPARHLLRASAACLQAWRDLQRARAS